jgi:hypothetical protein
VTLPTKGELYEALTGLGVEEVGDLEMLDEEDLCDLETKLKKVQQKQLKELLGSVHRGSTLHAAAPSDKHAEARKANGAWDNRLHPVKDQALWGVLLL